MSHGRLLSGEWLMDSVDGLLLFGDPVVCEDSPFWLLGDGDRRLDDGQRFDDRALADTGLRETAIRCTV